MLEFYLIRGQTCSDIVCVCLNSTLTKTDMSVYMYCKKKSWLQKLKLAMSNYRGLNMDSQWIERVTKLYCKQIIDSSDTCYQEGNHMGL